LITFTIHRKRDSAPVSSRGRFDFVWSGTTKYIILSFKLPCRRCCCCCCCCCCWFC